MSRINGRENLPKGGPLIVVGNHFHFLDPLMFIHLLPYPAEFVGGAKMPNAPGATHFLAAPVRGHPHRPRHCLA